MISYPTKYAFLNISKDVFSFNEIGSIVEKTSDPA
jgi:hypothetical protein